MDIESILTLVLGSGFLTTLVALSVTYFVDRKQKEKQRKIEQTDKLMADVYSPLLFLCLELLGYIGDIIGNFRGFEETKGSEEDKAFLIERLKKDRHLHSDSIKEILVTRIGFVKPKKFRLDLFYYFIALKEYERKITQFCDEGFSDGSEAEKKWLKNMHEVALDLGKMTTFFTFYVEKIMSSSDNEIKDSEYTKIISPEKYKEMLVLIYSKLGLKYSELTGT